MTENDLSPRQRALAGEFVKEGHSMEDAIQMASVIPDELQTSAEPIAWFKTDVRGRLTEFVQSKADAEAWQEQGFALMQAYAGQSASLREALEEILKEVGTSTRAHMIARNALASTAHITAAPQTLSAPKEMWAMLYLHDWDPPKEGQENRWEPGKNVFPDIHNVYETLREANAALARMSDPKKYWVRRVWMPAHGGSAQINRGAV
jgi:hypothetical protein